MKKSPEESEEIRLKIAELVRQLCVTASNSGLRPHLDDLVNILRALAMDPFGEIVIQACSAIAELAITSKELIFNFSELLGRALLRALVHKHSKVRLSGIHALRQLMYVGVYKHNVDIMSALIGFRDPNVVPIKDFYEHSTKLNYFAMLIRDENPIVRESFFKMLVQWMIDLPDKRDHENRIIPYLLSGLYDPNPDIQKLLFEQWEEIGRVYEEENEKDLREKKQFDIHEEWTYNGEVCYLKLPPPFAKRPRMGARILVRAYFNKFIKALLHELEDWQEENRERSVHLLLCALVYTEDYCTQHLDKMLIPLYKAGLQPSLKVIAEKLPLCMKLIGQYIPSKTYMKLILASINGELLGQYTNSQVGGIQAIGYILTGGIEALPSKAGFQGFVEPLTELVSALEKNILDQLTVDMCQHLALSIKLIITSIWEKAQTNGDLSILKMLSESLFRIAISISSFIHSTEGLKGGKLKDVQAHVDKVIEVFDKALYEGKSQWVLSNIKLIIKKLVSADYTNVTKFSLEIKELSLICRLLTKSELSSRIEGIASTEEKATVADVIFKTLLKILQESKNKEVFMRIITLCEQIMKTYIASDTSSTGAKSFASSPVHEIAIPLLTALSFAYDIDLEPVSFLAIKNKILQLLKLLRPILQSKKELLHDAVARFYLTAPYKALAMNAKDLEVKKLSLHLLWDFLQQSFNSASLEGGFPQNLLTLYPKEMQQLHQLLLNEIWNKDDDMRLSAAKCIQCYIGDAGLQMPAHDLLVATNVQDIVFSTQKSFPKPLIDQIKAAVAELDSAMALKSIGKISETADKLVGFAVDEGGEAREVVLNCLRKVGKGTSVVMLHEYVKAVSQGFLARIQLIRQIITDVLNEIVNRKK